MNELPPLDGLSHTEKDALIRGLWQELQGLRAEVEKLPQKRVKKTARNSSLPPSTGFKPNRIEPQSPPTAIEPRAEKPGGGRDLSPHPDQVVIAQAQRCPHCGEAVDPSTQQLHGGYERIELPRIQPHITRVERYGGTCACCQQPYEAPVPVGLEPGSPLGQSVAALVTYLRYSHALSYQRLLKRYQKIQSHLLRFLSDPTLPPTNHASEQALRWSVVFRKVTHGFRSEWGADVFAQVRSLVNTARRQGISAFDAICRALTSPQTDWLLS